MANVQSAIPFRQRKRTGIIETVKKSNVENENITQFQTPKRKLSKNSRDYDSGCSPQKIKRLNSITNELNKNFEDDTQNEKLNSPKPLVSREKEIAFLEDFLIDHLDNEKSVSLYISGQPGTGKTASLSYILQLDKIRHGFKQVYINCTMMKSASSIYRRLCTELQIKTSGASEKACLTAINKYFSQNHKMILLVLDEIDQLESMRQSVLYTIFEWPAQDHGIVLIGIANALDLTERTLPRLHARCSLRPQTLQFAAYTKQQIIDIFTHVLTTEDRTNVFSAPALQLLAAKIAAVSGDMRRALDIGRRVMEVARRSKFDQHKSLDAMLKDTTVTVELKQVLQVLNDVYGGSGTVTTEVEQTLPMQQKLILCSLLLMLKRKNKEIIMGKLHDVYKKVAASRNIASLDLSDLSSACGLLEARGALRITGGRGARGKRLALNWDETELMAALSDKPLMAAILADSLDRA